jgi:hypothetical protein
MASEVLESIAKDVATINVRIKEAQELIGAMQEAGEPTATLEADLRSLVIRKDKWQKMLEARGYRITP